MRIIQYSNICLFWKKYQKSFFSTCMICRYQTRSIKPWVCFLREHLILWFFNFCDFIAFCDTHQIKHLMILYHDKMCYNYEYNLSIFSIFHNILITSPFAKIYNNQNFFSYFSIFQISNIHTYQKSFFVSHNIHSRFQISLCVSFLFIFIRIICSWLLLFGILFWNLIKNFSLT